MDVKFEGLTVCKFWESIQRKISLIRTKILSMLYISADTSKLLGVTVNWCNVLFIWWEEKKSSNIWREKFSVLLLKLHKWQKHHIVLVHGRKAFRYANRMQKICGKQLQSNPKLSELELCVGVELLWRRQQRILSTYHSISIRIIINIQRSTSFSFSFLRKKKKNFWFVQGWWENLHDFASEDSSEVGPGASSGIFLLESVMYL